MMTNFLFTIMLTIFLAMWMMWRNNEDKMKLNRVDYEPLAVEEMEMITVNYISFALVLSLCINLLYIFSLC